VVDIDLYRKNRSTEEEVRGITAIWKLAGLVLLLMLLWAGFVNFKAFRASAELKSQNVASVTRVADFEGLYASQIEEKVRVMANNAQSLAAVSKEISYTDKLNVIPELLPAEMWLTRMEIRYPFTLKVFKEKNTILIEGYASTTESRTKELELGKTFTSAVNNSTVMKDICDGDAKVDYGFEDLSSGRARAIAVLGTKFSLRCEKDVK
jgi:hypothetical protein